MKRPADAHERDSENRINERPRNVRIADSEIDQILADSFPASDAPPWTLGVTSARSTTIRKQKKQRG